MNFPFTIPLVEAYDRGNVNTTEILGQDVSFESNDGTLSKEKHICSAGAASEC